MRVTAVGLYRAYEMRVKAFRYEESVKLKERIVIGCWQGVE